MLNLTNTPVFYVTRDIDRGLGLPPTDGYTIVTNKTPMNLDLAGDRQDVIWVESDEVMDTYEVLQFLSSRAKSRDPFGVQNNASHFVLNQRDKKGIPPLPTVGRDDKTVNIIVFKNTTQIERICSEHGWNLLNPSATLARTVEEKITQVEWLGELSSLLPPHSIKTCKEITEADLPCIVQFNHAHTGEGTLQLEQLEQLEQLQKDFPDRPVRVTQFISGMMFTNNNVVTPNDVLIGNINYQITGIAPYTQNLFQTIGNDWSFAYKTLSEEQVKTYHSIARSIGDKLRASGWKGLFGIDVMLESETGKLYLIEINARQPASTTYESTLQHNNTTAQQHIESRPTATTFEAHIRALLGENLSDTSLIQITDGAQLFDRRGTEPIVHRFDHSIVEKHSILKPLNV